MKEIRASSLLFCGPTEPAIEYKDCRFVVVPVPYDGTCTYGTGARYGPSAILEASANIELYEDVLGWEPYQAGIWTREAVEPVASGPDRMAERVESVVAAVLGDGKVPVLLGGEHGISIGAVRACRRRHPTLSVLVIDAHADLRAEYQGTPYSHACVQRRFLDLGCRVLQVGVRSLSAEEAAYRDEAGDLLSVTVRQYRGKEPLPSGGSLGFIYEHLTNPLYISIDLDGLDPSIMPATGAPEPGGLLWDEVWEILTQACDRFRIVGLDLVELQPIPGMCAPQVLAARLAYRLIGLIAGSGRR